MSVEVVMCRWRWFFIGGGGNVSVEVVLCRWRWFFVGGGGSLSVEVVMCPWSCYVLVVEVMNKCS